MSDTLTQLIAKAQANLGDDGTIFTTALLTASFRRALQEFNRRSPQIAAGLITGVNDQYEYEVSDLDPLAVTILDVLRQGDNADELDVSITYDAHNEDERVWFRLREPVTTSDILIVRYTLNHTINGLDSGTESTVLAVDDQTLVDGGCFYAVMTRATGRVETNNLNSNTAQAYMQIAGHYQTAFNLGLTNLARRRSAPVGEPDQRAWNDQYHNWGQ